jgi:hypothetical protein
MVPNVVVEPRRHHTLPSSQVIAQLLLLGSQEMRAFRALTSVLTHFSISIVLDFLMVNTVLCAVCFNFLPLQWLGHHVAQLELLIVVLGSDSQDFQHILTGARLSSLVHIIRDNNR